MSSTDTFINYKLNESNEKIEKFNANINNLKAESRQLENVNEQMIYTKSELEQTIEGNNRRLENIRRLINQQVQDIEKVKETKQSFINLKTRLTQKYYNKYIETRNETQKKILEKKGKILNYK